MILNDLYCLSDLSITLLPAEKSIILKELFPKNVTADILFQCETTQEYCDYFSYINIRTDSITATLLSSPRCTDLGSGHFPLRFALHFTPNQCDKTTHPLRSHNCVDCQHNVCLTQGFGVKLSSGMWFPEPHLFGLTLQMLLKKVPIWK